jgi:pilus assembly protein CpaE
MNPLAAGLVIATPELAAHVRESLYELPVRTLFERSELGDPAALVEEVERLHPELLIVELAGGADRVETTLRQLKSSAASPAVIVVQAEAQPDIIVAAMRGGADEYLYPPFDGRFRAAVERVAASQHQRTVPVGAGGKTLAMFSAKGGCGATTIACHLAVEFQRQTQQQILLADFDLDAGMIRFFLKTKSPYSVTDAANNVHRLDLNFWRALISNGLPRLEIIAAPAASAAPVAGDQPFRQVLRFARRHYDWILVDLGRSLNALTMNVLEEIDESLVVTTLDVPALYQAKQIVQTLLEAGYGRHRLHVVLNRLPKRPEVTLDEVERMLGVPVYATLPNDYVGLYEAYAGGNLVSPSSPLGTHFARLARQVGNLPGRPASKKRKFALF